MKEYVILFHVYLNLYYFSAMFSQVMQTVEPWYVSKEVYPTKVGAVVIVYVPLFISLYYIIYK